MPIYVQQPLRSSRESDLRRGLIASVKSSFTPRLLHTKLARILAASRHRGSATRTPTYSSQIFSISASS